VWALLIGLGLLGACGHWLLILAHRHAPASVLAPFFYSQIIGAAAFQVLPRSRLRTQSSRSQQSKRMMNSPPLTPDSLDNLPLLTDVVGAQPFDDLPTLTEVVTPDTPAIHTEAEAYVDTLSLDAPIITETHPSAVSDVPDALPAAVSELEALPTSPEAGTIIAAPAIETPAVKTETSISEEQLQQLLNKLQRRLEGKLMQQLAPQIALLQQQALEQALSELKAELPALLRNALNLTDSNK
jgi:hypothetical protein